MQTTRDERDRLRDVAVQADRERWAVVWEMTPVVLTRLLDDLDRLEAENDAMRQQLREDLRAETD